MGEARSTLAERASASSRGGFSTRTQPPLEGG
jgi:hypothetical protein